MKREHIDFLLDEVYPHIDDPNMVDVEDRPPGSPPTPEELNPTDHPDWAEYIRMICAQIETNEVQNAIAALAAGNDDTLSKRGELAVELVDLLESE